MVLILTILFFNDSLLLVCKCMSWSIHSYGTNITAYQSLSLFLAFCLRLSVSGVAEIAFVRFYMEISSKYVFHKSLAMKSECRGIITWNSAEISSINSTEFIRNHHTLPYSSVRATQPFYDTVITSLQFVWTRLMCVSCHWNNLMYANDRAPYLYLVLPCSLLNHRLFLFTL